MKLPKKKGDTAYNDGWDSTIEYAEHLCENYGEVFTKRYLLRSKEHALKRKEEPFFRGVYDCSVEIERLNEEVESEHRLDNFFQDSLDALDKLNIRSELSSCSKEEKNTKVVVDKEHLIKLLNYLSKDCPFELMKDEEPIFTCSLDNCLSDEPYCWKEWLKVKELPTKKINEEDDDIYEVDYKWGWNDCLDNILGGRINESN